MNSQKLKDLRHQLSHRLAGMELESDSLHEDILVIGHLRYEAIRKLHAADFTKLFQLNIQLGDFSFDYLVDLLVCGKTVDELVRLANES